VSTEPESSQDTASDQAADTVQVENPDAAAQDTAAEGASAGPAEDVAVETLPKRRVGLVLAVALVALIADQVTKIAVVSNLEEDVPHRILGGTVYLQLIRNGGAAFGIATGMTWILAVVAAAVVVAIVWLAARLRSVGWAIGLGLVLAGALGNLSDRIFRAPGPLQGHVVDFISLFAPNGQGWAIFNVADSCICVGGVLIVLLSLLGKDYDGRSIPRGRTKEAQ
jgi:signal peptidase II